VQRLQEELVELAVQQRAVGEGAAEQQLVPAQPRRADGTAEDR
jgi:hypothetical protein